MCEKKRGAWHCPELERGVSFQNTLEDGIQITDCDSSHECGKVIFSDDGDDYTQCPLHIDLTNKGNT
ncbi:MAG: hypothetical protein H8D45_07830 [Bacteroidetes bacterium]|nr:hypothetical protein [Bacteroidota bacterium]MBL7067685.1 hypothetical protein [Candidatus Neomarinimicrobiota bacterium]